MRGGGKAVRSEMWPCIIEHSENFRRDTRESLFRDSHFSFGLPHPLCSAIPCPICFPFHSPRGQPHILFSGEVKNAKLLGCGWEVEEYLKVVKMKECLEGVFRSTNPESPML